MSEEKKGDKKLYHNLFEGCVTARDIPSGHAETRPPAQQGQPGPKIKIWEQNTESAAWHRLLELVDEAASDGREVFAPAQDLGKDAWSEIITLPETISRLTRVKHLQLYGSALVRIPPAIGEMESLEVFTPYTSYELHWFPYEITRCQKLKDSTISTRALYGNRKTQKPFPRLPEQTALLYPENCSVCGGAFDQYGPIQRWTSQWVATDLIPLLVHACSIECIDRIPDAPEGHHQRPHRGEN